MKIKIVSNGVGHSTQVLDSDGKQIEGVTKVEIDPITPNELVTARLTFEFVELEIKAEDKTEYEATVPWGEWNTDGYWWPNRLLMMSVKEQYNANSKAGKKMKLTRSMQLEIFGEDFMRGLPYKPDGTPNMGKL